MDRALAAYRAGRVDASFTARTDVGQPDEQPVAVFFRAPEEMDPVDRGAIDAARGRVLDLGAGVGAHAIPLVEKGLEVTAVEPLPTAAAILRDRGVGDVREGALETLPDDARFDTILVLMNGVGLAGTLAGLPVFLGRLRTHLSKGGQVLLDSTDPRAWEDPGDGRYPGEVHYQLEFEGVRGPLFPFLYVDVDTLREAAATAGWTLDVVAEDGTRYLARLVPRAVG